MPRTIIIPLSDPQQDEEGIAEQALTCAEILTTGLNTRILLVSVIADESERAERQAYLDQTAGTIAGEVETLVEVGDPAPAILAASGRVEEPLIMMASHGRRGARLRLLGSVAAAVAEGARCPVMILPASPANEAPICKLIERVMLPINDNQLIEPIIDATLRELGDERAGRITFHLADVTAPLPPHPKVVDGERFTVADEVEAHFLRRGAELLRERGYPATWHQRIGDPARELTRLALEQGVNLIVMPAHSRTGFNSLIPDMFAAQVRAPETVPVLLVQLERDPA